MVADKPAPGYAWRCAVNEHAATAIVGKLVGVASSNREPLECSRRTSIPGRQHVKGVVFLTEARAAIISSKVTAQRALTDTRIALARPLPPQVPGIPAAKHETIDQGEGGVPISGRDRAGF